MVAGLAAGALTIGVAELLAALITPGSGPVVAVGQAFINATPAWLKDLAVSWFGSHDKTALLVGILVVVAVLAGGAGLLAGSSIRRGIGAVTVLGGIAATAAATRPGAGLVAALPTVLGTALGAAALALLVQRSRPAGPPVRAQEPAPDPTSPTRRALLLSGTVAGLGMLGGVAGRVLDATVTPADSPTSVRLPVATGTSPRASAANRLAVPGITPFVTSNQAFYRVDTALVVPRVDTRTWRLRIHGMVRREIVLSYQDLLRLPMSEHWTTLTCVSNPVGGTLAGNALWLGYPLADLLAMAEPHPDADMLLSGSVDGWTASTPLAAVTDGRAALVAVGMNGVPLPRQHGFPARLVIPGLYGYVSATKWLTDLRVTRFDQAQAYWTSRGYAAQAPVHTASRIDVPRAFARLQPGPVTVAGVAWAQHRGISAVQLRVDDGPWTNAELAEGIGTDTWRQWRAPWQATTGQHALQVRAVDGSGRIQTEQRHPSRPDGTTGWESVLVLVDPAAR